MWAWSNFLHSQCPPGLRPLRLNLDETGVRLIQNDRAGYLTHAAVGILRSPRSLRKEASRAACRAMFTLVTVICDDAAIQRVLPQVVLFPARLANAAVRTQIRQSLPPSIEFWVEDKCWMTTEIMIRVLLLLGRALQPFREERQVIFSCDAYKAHMTRRVWQALHR